MSTPRTANVANIEVREIPIEEVFASPDNPRKTFNPADIAELADSVRLYGIQVPLLVRLCAKSFEIVCGHRRRAAAELVGLASVPCIVREMTDEEAAEIAVIDNLQRVDVPALEEAEAFKALLETHGAIDAVAARVGKDVAHVARRLKLCTLGVFQRQALSARLITVDHALLLARLGVEEQDEALKWALDRNAGSKTPVEKVVAARIEENGKPAKNRYYGYTWQAETPLRLKEHIEEKSGRKLSRAPWSLDDPDLVQGAAACNACPQNTKANTALFADLAIEAATCSDGACFEQKRAAYVQIKLAAVKDGLRLSWKQTSTEPRFLKSFASVNAKQEFIKDTVNPTQLFKYGQWVEAKKDSCKNVLIGVTVDWSDANDRGYMGNGERLSKPGQVLTVCVAAKCKTHKKSWEKTKEPSSNGLRNENSAEAKADREKKEAAAKAENAVRADLVKAAIAKVDKLTPSLIRRLVLRALPDEWNRVDGSDEMFPGLDKGLGTFKADSVEFAKAAACILFIEERSDVWVSEWEPIDKGRKEFIALLKDLGYDASNAWEKPPEPKAAKPAAKKSILSAAAKKRIAAAQKKRWAMKKAGRK